MTVVDEEVADVGDPSESVGEDEDRVALVKRGVGEEEQGPCDAEPPEGDRDDDLLAFFGRIPLNKETAEENAIAQPSNQFPRMPLDA